MRPDGLPVLKGPAPVSGQARRGILARSGSVRSRAAASGPGAREVRKSSVVLLPCTPASVAIARRQLIEDLLAAGVFSAAIRGAGPVVRGVLSNAVRHGRA